MPSKAVLTFAIALVLTGVLGCSKDSPSVRVFNERPSKANAQFKFPAGNTININDVASGAATPYQDIATGPCVVTATIQSESVSPMVDFNESEGLALLILSTNELMALSRFTFRIPRVIGLK
jgi:hypothetical protein